MIPCSRDDLFALRASIVSGRSSGIPLGQSTPEARDHPRYLEKGVVVVLAIQATIWRRVRPGGTKS